MRCCCRSRAGAAGFSLIEVLVALVVVGLALAAAAETIGNGLLGHEAARDVDTALAFADDMLAETGIADRLRPGDSAGSFAERFEWHRTIAAYADPQAGRFPEKADGPGLYRIAITVAWQDGRRRRQIAVSTLRLGPAAR